MSVRMALRVGVFVGLALTTAAMPLIPLATDVDAALVRATGTAALANSVGRERRGDHEDASGDESGSGDDDDRSNDLDGWGPASFPILTIVFQVSGNYDFARLTDGGGAKDSSEEKALWS